MSWREIALGFEDEELEFAGLFDSYDPPADPEDLAEEREADQARRHAGFHIATANADPPPRHLTLAGQRAELAYELAIEAKRIQRSMAAQHEIREFVDTLKDRT